jgi:uncharacterized protein YqgC (DUF456 family)
MESILVWTAVVGLFAVGLVGTLVPAVPGLPLVWLGIALYAWATGFAEIGVTAVAFLGLLTAGVVAGSYASGAIAAKAGGGARWAVGGAAVGAILGLITASLPGLLLGSFLGALLGAWWETRQTPRAFTVALLAVVGLLVGVVAQFLMGVAMIVGFLFTVLL